MQKLLFIFILCFFVFQTFAQIARHDKNVLDDRLIPDRLNLGHLTIQTVSPDAKLEISKLGVSNKQVRNSLLFENVYPEAYDLSFRLGRQHFDCVVSVEPNKMLHLWVDVGMKSMVSRLSDYTPPKADNDSFNSDKVFVMVEEMPEFPGGVLALRKWIKSNVKYPERARRNRITGKVYIGFVVNRKGDVEDCKVLRSIDTDLDNEALRVVNKMPSWKPGKQEGKPVRVSFSFPISFHIRR